MELIIPERYEHVLRALRHFCDHPGDAPNGMPNPPIPFPRIPRRIDGPTKFYWLTHSDNLEMVIDPIGDETVIELRPRGRIVDHEQYEALLALMNTLSGQTSSQDAKRKVAKSKRGPRRYSLVEKVEARRDWDDLDRDLHAITLEEFLEDRFGSVGGKLTVPTSTFYGWPKE